MRGNIMCVPLKSCIELKVDREWTAMTPASPYSIGTSVFLQVLSLVLSLENMHIVLVTLNGNCVGRGS